MTNYIGQLFDAALTRVFGRSAAKRIEAKQAQIARVTERNVAHIESVIGDEVTVLRHQASHAFQRIQALVGTGALTMKQNAVLVKARSAVEKAIDELEALA